MNFDYLCFSFRSEMSELSTLKPSQFIPITVSEDNRERFQKNILNLFERYATKEVKGADQCVVRMSGKIRRLDRGFCHIFVDCFVDRDNLPDMYRRCMQLQEVWNADARDRKERCGLNYYEILFVKR